MSYIPLPDRGVIALYGSDVKDFLQNIITNDINKLDNQKAIYSLLLNANGKYLYDFFLIKYEKYIFLECALIYLNQIIEKLTLLKTHLKVRIKDISKLYRVGILINSNVEYQEIVFQDPRHISLGVRIIHKDEIREHIGDFNVYELNRIKNLVPDGVKDMIQNSSFPLQYLIDSINGIDFNKGCYIGQEVVNRMKRQQILRRKLYLVEANDALPAIDTKIINTNGEEVGEMRSSINNIGLALLYTGKNDTILYANKTEVLIVH